jgi:hypothetical protein
MYTYQQKEKLDIVPAWKSTVAYKKATAPIAAPTNAASA